MHDLVTPQAFILSEKRLFIRDPADSVVKWQAESCLLGSVERDTVMPIHLGATELILILFLIILFFGPGRIAKISGEAGKSIHLFKKNLQNQQDKEKKS